MTFRKHDDVSQLIEVTTNGAEVYAYPVMGEINVGVNEADHACLFLTPEEAVRFGFHLAGLGAKALRAGRPEVITKQRTRR